MKRPHQSRHERQVERVQPLSKDDLAKVVGGTGETRAEDGGEHPLKYNQT